MPYEGVAAAFWLSLGDRVELRRTDYDVPRALDMFSAMGYDEVDSGSMRELLGKPTARDEVTELFESHAREQAKGR